MEAIMEKCLRTLNSAFIIHGIGPGSLYRRRGADTTLPIGENDLLVEPGNGGGLDEVGRGTTARWRAISP